MTNWLRIGAIGGVAFFTTLIGLWGATAAFQFTLGWKEFMLGSLLSASVQAGLAVCQELKVETETSVKACKGMKRNMLFLM